jgi:hypothetical protein
LITKRGFAKVNKQRLPITDNAMIERELGEHGIVCTEGACLWHSVQPFHHVGHIVCGMMRTNAMIAAPCWFAILDMLMLVFRELVP